MDAEHLGYNSLRASRVHTFNHVTRSRTKHIVKMAVIWSDEKGCELSGLWRMQPCWFGCSCTSYSNKNAKTQGLCTTFSSALLAYVAFVVPVMEPD